MYFKCAIQACMVTLLLTSSFCLAASKTPLEVLVQVLYDENCAARKFKKNFDFDPRYRLSEDKERHIGFEIEFYGRGSITKKSVLKNEAFYAAWQISKKLGPDYSVKAQNRMKYEYLHCPKLHRLWQQVQTKSVLEPIHCLRMNSNTLQSFNSIAEHFVKLSIRRFAGSRTYFTQIENVASSKAPRDFLIEMNALYNSPIRQRWNGRLYFIDQELWHFDSEKKLRAHQVYSFAIFLEENQGIIVPRDGEVIGKTLGRLPQREDLQHKTLSPMEDGSYEIFNTFNKRSMGFIKPEGSVLEYESNPMSFVSYKGEVEDNLFPALNHVIRSFATTASSKEHIGVHFHIEMDLEDLRPLHGFLKKYIEIRESLFQFINPKTQRVGIFAQEIPQDLLNSILRLTPSQEKESFNQTLLKLIRDYKRPNSLDNDRYLELNILGLLNKVRPTLEFRMLDSDLSLNGQTKMKSVLKILLALASYGTTTVMEFDEEL